MEAKTGSSSNLNRTTLLEDLLNESLTTPRNSCLSGKMRDIALASQCKKKDLNQRLVKKLILNELDIAAQRDLVG